MPEEWTVGPRPAAPVVICRIAGCGKRARYTRDGLCSTHYQRRMRTGSFDLRSVEDRLWSRVAPTGFCWEWDGAHDSSGYGIFTLEDRRVDRPHRVVYRMLIGPIPSGLELDHLCRNRGCCNPDHLEPVTPEENKRRARAIRTLGCPSPASATNKENDMSTDTQPIEVGDRFEDRDPRNAGRTVQVIDGTRSGDRVRVRVETHPLNPDAIGRRIYIARSTLREKYRRQSR